MVEKRNFEGIDFLKGFLIILVIVAHILLKRLDQSIIRYVIYSFHMPLFLAISGFLLRKEKIFTMSFIKLIKKYWFRILVPAIIASTTYFIIINKKLIITREVTLNLIAKWILYPYYHLWYIYSLFVMIIFLWIFLKLKVPRRIILIISFLFTLLWLWKYWYDPLIDPGREGIKILGDKKTYYYFCFFYLGFYIRNYKTKTFSKINYLILIGILSGLRILDFHYLDNHYFSTVNFILLNAVIIFYALNYVVYKEFDKGKICDTLKAVGRMSLPIYLWHQAAILIFRTFLLGKVDMKVYYPITMIICIFDYIPLIFILSKNRFINDYIFGGKKV